MKPCYLAAGNVNCFLPSTIAWAKSSIALLPFARMGTGGMNMLATVPFTFTRQERKERGDPRPSVEERYASKEDYLDRVEQVAKELVSRRYLLEEDIPRLTQMAAERYELLEATIADPQPADD